MIFRTHKLLKDAANRLCDSARHLFSNTKIKQTVLESIFENNRSVSEIKSESGFVNLCRNWNFPSNKFDLNIFRENKNQPIQLLVITA